MRAEAWAILSDYSPVCQELKSDILHQKHEQYTNLLKHYFGRMPSLKDTVEELVERT